MAIVNRGVRDRGTREATRSDPPGRGTGTRKLRKHPQNDLPILVTSGDGSPEPRAVTQYSGFGDDLAGYYCRELRMSVLKELGKTIEVGKRRRRPFDFHRLCQGLNAGVPQLSSQRTTSSCGTVGSPASIAAQRRSNSAISSRSTATGPLSAAISASNWATVTPRSSARAFNASAVASSTSMVWVLEGITERYGCAGVMSRDVE